MFVRPFHKLRFYVPSLVGPDRKLSRPNCSGRVEEVLLLIPVILQMNWVVVRPVRLGWAGAVFAVSIKISPWSSCHAPYQRLKQRPSSPYLVSFALPTNGWPYHISFRPSVGTMIGYGSRIQALHNVRLDTNSYHLFHHMFLLSNKISTNASGHNANVLPEVDTKSLLVLHTSALYVATIAPHDMGRRVCSILTKPSYWSQMFVL